MQRQRPFIYNPSDDIQETAEKSAQGIEKGFGTLIKKRMQDYELVTKANEDIELLKEDLNIYNSETITKQADDLLASTAGAIKKRGKVDYKELGNIRKQISKISQSKRNNELALKAMEGGLAMLKEQAPNIYDLGKTTSEMMAAARNPENLNSPKAMDKVITEIYSKGLNMPLAISKRLFNTASEFKETVTTSDGNLVEMSGKMPKGFVFDKKTRRFVPESQEALDLMVADLFKTEQEMATFKEQYLGNAGAFENNMNEAAAKFLTDEANSTLSVSKTVETAAQRAQRMASANNSNTNAEYKQKQIENYDKELELKIQEVRNDTTRANATAQNAKVKLLQFGLDEAETEAVLAKKGLIKQPSGEFI